MSGFASQKGIHLAMLPGMTDFPILTRSGDLSAPTLVCLPYFGGSARTFAALWPLLPASWNLRAYTPTGIGVGEDGSYSLETAFEQLAQTIRRDVQGDFHLVGHSMCGKMALGAAALGLEGLQNLILLAPSPPSPEPIPDDVRQTMLQTHGTREAALTTIRGVTTRPLSGELLELAIEDNLAMSERDWKNWLELGSREDKLSILEGVRVPVKIIIGEGDEGMTPDLMTRTIIEPLRGLEAPATQLHIIANAGHLLPLEAPQELAQLLSKWV